MITRPLDLLSKLRPPPRNYDFLFLVNGGLIALFFALFGSNFVLSPGLNIDGRSFQMVSGPAPDLTAARVIISVNASDQMWGDSGLITPSRLKDWMRANVKDAQGTRLLIIADERASQGVLAQITAEATAAGFSGVTQAVQSASAPSAPEVVFPK